MTDTRWTLIPNSLTAPRLWLPPVVDHADHDPRLAAFDDDTTLPDAIQTLPPEQAREVLRSVVEAEVIPHLVSFCAGGADDDTVAAFTELLQQHSAAAAIQMIEDATDAGVPIETLFLDLLSPAARRLGTMWQEDSIDMVTVTCATFHLQQVLLHVAPAFRQERAQTGQAHSALLTVAPGGQHSFGVSMLAEFFRRGGWQVRQAPVDRVIDLARIVRRNWLSLAGISVGSNDQLDITEQCIRAMRKSARNRDMLIMVGGPAINADPSLVERLGADFTAADGRQAVIQAERLLRIPAAGS